MIAPPVQELRRPSRRPPEGRRALSRSLAPLGSQPARVALSRSPPPTVLCFVAFLLGLMLLGAMVCFAPHPVEGWFAVATFSP